MYSRVNIFVPNTIFLPLRYVNIWNLSYWNGNCQSWRSCYFKWSSIWKKEILHLIQIYSRIIWLKRKQLILIGLLGSKSILAYIFFGGVVAIPSMVSFIIPFTCIYGGNNWSRVYHYHHFCNHVISHSESEINILREIFYWCRYYMNLTWNMYPRCPQLFDQPYKLNLRFKNSSWDLQ